MSFVFRRRDKSLGEVRLGTITLQVRAALAPSTQALAVAAPTFMQSVRALGDGAAAEIPATELLAVARYLSEQVLSVEGVTDERGEALGWADLDAGERVELLVSQRPEDLCYAYGQYAIMDLYAKRPDLIEEALTGRG